MSAPFVTVIIPCRNEEASIGKILEFFIHALPENKELIIADGGSTDRTKEIVSAYSSKHPGITLLDNPEKYVPFALNRCIKMAKGDYIIRLDAHTEYAEDYFQKVLEVFETTKADIVGGPMRAKGNSSFQRAVAICTSTVFGVGDSKFHDSNAEGYTDSVYLGAWKKSIFEKTGFFDEEMLRNQDDEFHYRAKSLGVKIYLSPLIRSWYFPRSNFRKLMKQYFQYGLFKPLVLRKVSSEIKLRHLIPSAFLIYLAALPFFLILAGIFSLAPFVLYVVIDILFSFRKQQSLSEKLFSLAVYPALHISYGLGLMIGLSGALRKQAFHD